MHAQTPVQIAWVTRDLDATEKALTTLLGAKKWVRVPDVHFAPDTCTFRGRPADFTAHISFSYAGDTQLELIAPVSGESVYSEFLDTAGPGLHHVCIEAPDSAAFDAALRDAERQRHARRGAGGHARRHAVRLSVGRRRRRAHTSRSPYIPGEIKAFFDYVKQEQQ